MIIKDPTPISSFLSLEKDMGIIVDNFLRNERLKRLLFYTSPDALSKPNIGEENTVNLIGRNIKNVPKQLVDDTVLNYITVTFDNFIPNPNNPQFRNNIVEFEIVCHFNQWQLKDFQLRPYKIAAEIDSMFNGKHLTGIGKLDFLGANQIVLNDEFAGLCLYYKAIHGDEDKKIMTTPEQEERFLQDFEDMMNSEI